jgi:hypothetical protein
LAGARVADKVGFIAARVDTLVYQMSFRMDGGSGTVILNTSVLDAADLTRALVEMQSIFACGFGMGNRLVMAREGESIGGVKVPPGSVVLGTICSVTVNGILLHEGIPVTSRYGGLLQVKDGRAVRFLDLIEYRGTTLDPLEVFIQAGMTQTRGVARIGSGRVGASFREVPSVALDDVKRIALRMKKRGMGGILAMGQPNQPLLGIPVSEGRAGMIVIGGLNPMAAVHEAGIQVSCHSLAGLQDYSTLVAIDELRRRVWRAGRA